MSRNRYITLLRLTFRSLNWFEIFLIVSIMTLAVISWVVKGNYSFNGIVAGISAILGVFCVVLGAKGAMANWLFGIVEGVLHIYICFCTHIYGDFLQRLLYNLPMQFFGWKSWKKRRRHDDTGVIKTRYMTWRQRLATFLVVATGTLCLGLFLIHFGPWMFEQVTALWHSMGWGEIGFQTLKPDYDTKSQLWLDSFTTIMSIVTMFVSVKAFVEQWYMWLFINIAYIAMWLMSDSDFSFMTTAKYCIYLINSFYGIYMWNKLSK
ncbi:MAG: nicotinamide mononucleotide transporter [Bacteroidales bacterium]|nr:nicotinamide mononucleotide transporter [Bacteroidales bacterium]